VCLRFRLQENSLDILGGTKSLRRLGCMDLGKTWLDVICVPRTDSFVGVRY
jgi:hypothetical protein